MNRREFLSLAAVSVGLAGCVSDGDEGNTGGPTSSPTDDVARSTDTESTFTLRHPSTDGCQWPSMCEDSVLVKIAVREGFSGEVVLEADCRDGDVDVDPGQTRRVVREADGEDCSVSLSVDGETVYDERISGNRRVTLTVTASGEVEKDEIIY